MLTSKKQSQVNVIVGKLLCQSTKNDSVDL